MMASGANKHHTSLDAMLAAAAAAGVEEPGEAKLPRTHKQAMLSAEARQWRNAEISEYRSHIKNGTFGPPVQLPPGAKAIPTAGVYVKKRDGRYKYRLVIRGYRMEEGKDFNDTFAPVANIVTLRTLFALGAKFDWEMKMGDVPTAFLNADMDAEIYAWLPAGFNDNPSTEVQKIPRTAVQVRKALYGGPQCPRLYYQRSDGVITKAGLQRSGVDHSLYYDLSRKIFLVVWVDDLFYFFPRESADHALKIWDAIRKELNLPEWHDIDDCLGCHVQRDRLRRTITLSQEKMAGNVVQRAKLEDCKPADTPVANGFIFTKEDCPQTEKERLEFSKQATWYRSMLASCIYLCTWTRPDIAFAISKLSKFMQNPGPKHVMALKRLLRYLRGTAKHGLRFSFGSDGSPRSGCKTGVYGFYDASFADDVDTRRSTMGYVFYFEGCPLSWHSKLHTYVTTSTNHSEYCCAAKAAREAKFMETLFQSIGFQRYVKPIALFSDSAGAIAMTYNPVQRAASKHIDLADHYAREQVERGTITVSYVPTEDMIADIFTKALPKAQFLKLGAYMVVCIDN